MLFGLFTATCFVLIFLHVSLNFIRLLRVIISPSVMSERRKRLEAIGWISGYPRVFLPLCLKWSHKSSFNPNKPHQFALRLSVPRNQANVLKHMFDLTWWIVYIFHDIFHLFYTFPHCQRLINMRFSCEICFCQLFGQFGTEFLCLANLTFRFVVMWSIRSFAAICSAYKWIHLHLVRV